MSRPCLRVGDKLLLVDRVHHPLRPTLADRPGSPPARLPVPLRTRPGARLGHRLSWSRGVSGSGLPVRQVNPAPPGTYSIGRRDDYLLGIDRNP